MKLQRCREQAGFPHDSSAMHLGTVATTLLTLRLSSWKEVPNGFAFLTTSFLALKELFSPFGLHP